MKHKWLAFALVVLAALGAAGVAVTGGQDPLVYATAVVLASTLFFVKRGWWGWVVIGAAAGVLGVGVALLDGPGWYLLPSAFLAAFAGLLDVAAPKQAATR